MTALRDFSYVSNQAVNRVRRILHRPFSFQTWVTSRILSVLFEGDMEYVVSTWKGCEIHVLFSSVLGKYRNLTQKIVCNRERGNENFPVWIAFWDKTQILDRIFVGTCYVWTFHIGFLYNTVHVRKTNDECTQMWYAQMSLHEIWSGKGCIMNDQKGHVPGVYPKNIRTVEMRNLNTVAIKIRLNNNQRFGVHCTKV